MHDFSRSVGMQGPETFTLRHSVKLHFGQHPKAHLLDSLPKKILERLQSADAVNRCKKHQWHPWHLLGMDIQDVNPTLTSVLLRMVIHRCGAKHLLILLKCSLYSDYPSSACCLVQPFGKIPVLQDGDFTIFGMRSYSITLLIIMFKLYRVKQDSR